ncbi:g_PROTEIN_RECEP_F1_2 domain-containing protein [Caerostris extrusa]|uniref:G_PROTEIN_RECEP_F1_2 domain-containing protein n=1 Tax=Caerostris extrusa TaxID=172846 RepID=A0AAV4PB04_CAEEX|nr:g_PROTEIN_RECEP_F1_2 domain-containing protein [Caerostris extrusa]
MFLNEEFRKNTKYKFTTRELSYAELFFEESHLWNEWQSSKFVSIITFLFLVLELPFIIKQTDYLVGSDKLSLSNGLTPQNSTLNSSLPLTHITPPIERAFSWTKFTFCLLFPITTLILRKDIRRKLNSVISFFRPSSSIPSKNEYGTSIVHEESPDDFLVPQVWRRRRRLSSVTCLTTPLVFGQCKVANTQFQLLDLSAGMAKWKASYNESKREEKRHGKTFFDNAFEDEEELTEFERYEDGTEDEINSSENFGKEIASVKEAAVQTNDKCFQEVVYYQQVCNSSQRVNNPNRCLEKQSSLEKRKHRNRNRRLSKSFTTSSRTTNEILNHRIYMTYPKVPSNVRLQSNFQVNTTSDLLKALKAYRSRKYLTVCDIFPRGTAELMDVTTENKHIVSL